MQNDEEGGLVLGIDLNKAFDRVEHEFIYTVDLWSGLNCCTGMPGVG